MNKIIHNVETGEVSEVALSAEEIELLESTKANIEAYRKAEADKLAARNAILEKLGLSEEEAKLLLG